MKKVLSILVVACMMLSLVTIAGAADYALAINNNVAVMVGNTNAIAYNGIKSLPVAPIEENGVMLAPASFVTAGFNGVLNYDAASGLVSIKLGTDREAQMLIGSNYAVVEGRVYAADIAPRLVDGQVMVPVEFLAETVLGKHVYYDAATKMAVITQNKCLSSRDKDAINTIAGALTSGVLPEIVITAPSADSLVSGWTSGVVGGGVTNTNGTVAAAPTGSKVALTTSMLRASQEPQPENPVRALLDGNNTTVWASEREADVVVDLGSAMTVSTVGVAMKLYEDERVIPYDIAISSDGSSYTQVWSGESDVMSDAVKYVSFSAGARYVKITAYGNTTSGWNSVAELEIYSTGAASVATASTTTTDGGAAGTVVATASGSKVTLTSSMIKVSQEPQPENPAVAIFDGDKNTVWASEREANVVVDLGSAKTVSTVGVAMKLYEDERIIPYDIAVSSDGVSYSQVWSGESEVMTDATKYVSVGKAARYVKVTAYGNTVSGWTSLAELEIYSSGAATGTATTTTTTTTATTGAAGSVITTPTGTKATLTSSMIKVSQEPQPENPAVAIFDGDKNTVWASEREANVVVDLGSAKNLSCIGVAMKLYEDERTIPYDISVSADGVSYTQVWSGSSEVMTDATKYVSASQSARYVKVTAYGNTVSGWTSLAELEIYTK